MGRGGWRIGLLAAVIFFGPLASSAAALCTIDGPTTASVNSAFTLCGPAGDGYTYEWFGPGIQTARSRCVTITGRPAGTYEYELVTRIDGDQHERCVHTVRVGGASGGSLVCQVSGPQAISAGQTVQLCGPQSSLHEYEWTGPAGFTATTRCVTVSRAGIYGLTIRNSLTGYVRECSHRLEAAGAVGFECDITGPASAEAGAGVELCGPRNANFSYRWQGPGGFTAGSRCVVVTDEGDYSLTIRNVSGGATYQCSHRLDLTSAGGAASCSITGPQWLTAGRRARLCGQSIANHSYRWTGPNGYQATTRCIDVDEGGAYDLTMRDLSQGTVRRCSFTLQTQADPGDPDAELSENCPKALGYWRGQCGSDATAGTRELSTQDVRAIARCIDERSKYFNWSNDYDGLCQVLRPAAPLTNRKQVARHFAALLANVCARDLDLVSPGTGDIGLDPTTRIAFRNIRTIEQLITLVDNLLLTRTGNYVRVAQTLNAVNQGRGIGPVCD
ncbi:MAG TPA: hypothetical protein VEY91_11955 [Candidatus Limnocylindria bacterium]|nr:hypothetical protein [Candidatus Limnocylindria bacterium]